MPRAQFCRAAASPQSTGLAGLCFYQNASDYFLSFMALNSLKVFLEGKVDFSSSPTQLLTILLSLFPELSVFV